jgi:hypothetical protein
MTIATLICVCPIPLCQLCKLNTFFQYFAKKDSCMLAKKKVICSVHPHRFVVIWVAVTTVETRSEYTPVSLFRNFNHMNNLKCFRTRSWLGKLTMVSNGQIMNWYRASYVVWTPGQRSAQWTRFSCHLCTLQPRWVSILVLDYLLMAGDIDGVTLKRRPDYRSSADGIQCWAVPFPIRDRDGE